MNVPSIEHHKGDSEQVSQLVSQKHRTLLSKVGIEHQVVDVQRREISFHNEKNKNFYKLNDQTFKSNWPIEKKNIRKIWWNRLYANHLSEKAKRSFGVKIKRKIQIKKRADLKKKRANLEKGALDKKGGAKKGSFAQDGWVEKDQPMSVRVI